LVRRVVPPLALSLGEIRRKELRLERPQAPRSELLVLTQIVMIDAVIIVGSSS